MAGRAGAAEGPRRQERADDGGSLWEQVLEDSREDELVETRA
jgi:hypothetical protein